MAHAQSPKIITDGLVFCYDMGNKKSWRGRPTDNLFYTTAASIGIDSQTGITTGSNQYGDYFIKSQAAGAQWWGGLRILNNGTLPLTSGSSYVFSIEVMSPQTGWSYSYDSNQLGGDWSGNDLGRISVDSYFVDSLNQSYGNIPNVWKRLYYKVQMKTWSTGGNAYPNDSFYPSTDNILLYYRNPQLELSGELSPFIGGSRSSTDSLVDLTNGNTITINNLTYNSSDYNFSFAGSDYISLPNSIGYNTEFSMFAWFKSTGTPVGGYHILFGGQEGEISIPTSGALRVGVTTTSRFVNNLGSGLTDGNWHYVGMTYKTSTGTIQGYIDGYSVGSVAADTNPLVTSYTRTVGRFGSSTTYYTNGSQPISQIYNRSLSNDEVLQNFNALRGRFGV